MGKVGRVVAEGRAGDDEFVDWVHKHYRVRRRQDEALLALDAVLKEYFDPYRIPMDEWFKVRP